MIFRHDLCISGLLRAVFDLDVVIESKIERRDDQVRVKIGWERSAFEAWWSRSAASALPAAVVPPVAQRAAGRGGQARSPRSEEHTSELQSLTISYAVFCLKKKTTRNR